MMKKIVSLSLALLLALSLTACGSKQEAPAPAEPPVQETPVQEEAPAASVEAPVTTRIAALKGPTAMGLVKLMSDAPHSADGPMYDFTLAGAADEVTPSLIKGDLDMACVPANLASVLYNKTEGEIITLAVNTLGVIYIVENGNAVQSMADLAGKTIVAAGKGSTPEYALRYLLSENGIDPNKVVEAQAKVPTAMAEALANGRLGVMDYYRLNNIQADTQMRRTIAEVSPEGEEKPEGGK